MQISVIVKKRFYRQADEHTDIHSGLLSYAIEQTKKYKRTEKEKREKERRGEEEDESRERGEEEIEEDGKEEMSKQGRIHGCPRRVRVGRGCI